MEPIRGHDVPFDPFGDRLRRLDRRAAPVDQRRSGNVDAEAGEDLGLAIEWQVVVELGDEDVGEEAGAGDPAIDRSGRGRRPHQVKDAVAAVPTLRMEMVKHTDDMNGFVVPPRCWPAEHTFSW